MSPQDDLDDRCTCSDCTGKDWDWDDEDEDDEPWPSPWRWPLITVTPAERFL